MSFVRLYMVVLTYFMIENFHIPDQSCVFTNAIGSSGVSFKHRRLHGLETKYFGILLFAVPPYIAVPNSREFLSYERISHPESSNFMLLLSLTFSCVPDISFNFFFSPIHSNGTSCCRPGRCQLGTSSTPFYYYFNLVGDVLMLDTHIIVCRIRLLRRLFALDSSTWRILDRNSLGRHPCRL